MTDTYEGNGDYTCYDDDNDYAKQRKNTSGGCIVSGPHNGDNLNHNPRLQGCNNVVIVGDCGQLNEKANDYIRDCLNEKSRMDRKFPIAEKLLDCEIEKVQAIGRIPLREQKYADIYREKPLRVSQKVLVPIREHPKFNFVGKLLGPKGNSLRRLQEETLCKMTVLGRNSMRDRLKEEELRNSKDPKYAHLNSDLHVEIITIAPPAQAYARIAYAMAELRKYLIPDSNDVIRQEQLRELMDNTGIPDNDCSKPCYKKILHQSGISAGLNVALSCASATTGSVSKNAPHHNYRGSQQSAFGKNAIAPKQKVLSILEKARSAMDDTYGRSHDDISSYEQTNYDSYTYGHAPTSVGIQNLISHVPQTSGISIGAMTSRNAYDAADFEPEFNRRDYYQHSPNYGGGSSGVSTSLNSHHNRSHINR